MKSLAIRAGFAKPLDFCCGTFSLVLVMCRTPMQDGGTTINGTACSDHSTLISWNGAHYTSCRPVGCFSNPQPFLLQPAGPHHGRLSIAKVDPLNFCGSFLLFQCILQIRVSKGQTTRKQWQATAHSLFNKTSNLHCANSYNMFEWKDR